MKYRKVGFAFLTFKTKVFNKFKQRTYLVGKYDK